MKIPLNWLSKYITLEHTPEEIGAILTDLEFMQDGPIKEVKGQPVLDIEVRQNRPDALSILGVAREYSAYINKPLNKIDLYQIETEKVKPVGKNLRVEDTNNVKRFFSVEIDGVEIKDSPNFIRDSLEAYGIPSINNIVDITNFVMLETGMPMHAFDYSKLSLKNGNPILTLRKALEGEKFNTWQGSEIELSTSDTIVADANGPVALAGIIGGNNSGIDDSTTKIILESACYNQAAVRRSSIRNNLRTESSSRHEKFLNPEMVEFAIQRAINLIKEFAGGEIISIEDYYGKPEPRIEIDFNINEIDRLGGIYIEVDRVSELLARLGFDIIEHKESIGIDQNILSVRVPIWRTDIRQDADIVEEVLRLNGYSNIPLIGLSSTAPDYSTPKVLQLEELVKDILVNLGLFEHMVSPFVKFDEENKKQIKIENPLNSEIEALRTSIRETLYPVAEYYTKAGKNKFGIFESGKVYFKKKEGEYGEEKRVDTLYVGYDFAKKVKPDLYAILEKLGFDLKSLRWNNHKNHLTFSLNGESVADLYHDGYTLYLEKIVEIVNLIEIPKTHIKTSIVQQISEDISLFVESTDIIGNVADYIHGFNEYIKSITVQDIFVGDNDKKSVTLRVLFEDAQNSLTREKIESIKKDLFKTLKDKYNAVLRS